MEDSPQNRRSIPNNLKPYRIASQKFGWHSCLFLLLMAVSIVACLYILLVILFSSQSQEARGVLQESNIQDSRGIINLSWPQDLLQGQEDHQISIPVVNSKQCQITKQNMRQKLEQTLSNVKLFAILHNQYAINYNVLSQNFYKISPLFAVRHPKFTSPSTNSSLSFFDINWWNPFYQSNKYEGVNKIFDSKNNKAWVSQGNYFTVVSDEPFKPSFIVIELGEETKELNNYLYLYGLMAFDCVITNKQTLEQILIKKVELKIGRNLIQCDKPECTTQYSMLMLYMEEVNIMRLEVYSKKKYGIPL